MMKGNIKEGLRLLVAIKAKKCRDAAAQMAASILNATGGEVALLAAVSGNAARPRVEADLKCLEETLGLFPVKKIIRIGEISKVIGEVTEDGGYDLLIIGEQPKKRFFRILALDRLERVIKELNTPVLVTRQHEGPLRRFLVCEGGLSSRLLPAITGRLRPLMLTAEKITILHVMSEITAAPEIPSWELSAEAEELIAQQTPKGKQLELDLSTLSSLGVSLEVKVRHGIVVEEILAEAEEGDYDVIVLGTPKSTGFQRYLVDDPIHKILINGNRPVMIL